GGEQLLVGVMDTVRIYRQNSQGKFTPAEELPGHHGLVRDVDWAPSLGRSYHLIATACKDGYVRIFRLTDPRSTFSPRPSRPPSRSRENSTNLTAAYSPSRQPSLSKEPSNLSSLSRSSTVANNSGTSTF